MTTAYLDSSLLLALVFGEAGSAALRRILTRYERLVSSDLLVAECLAAAKREALDGDAMLAAPRPVDLVLPPRSLVGEIREALDEGQLRGTDLWHLACALFVANEARGDVAFLSRDKLQRQVAKHLGFPTP